MSITSWKIEKLHSVRPSEFFRLILKNKEYIHPTFPVTVSSCETLWKTKSFFSNSKKLKKQGKGEYFVLKEEKTETLIGYFQIKNISQKISRCEFAYFVDQDFQGQGIVSELVSKMIIFAFNELEMEKVVICTSKENQGSQQIAIKNKFQQEGVLRNEFKNYLGQLEDVVYFGLLKSDYQKHEK